MLPNQDQFAPRVHPVFFQFRVSFPYPPFLLPRIGSFSDGLRYVARVRVDFPRRHVFTMLLERFQTALEFCQLDNFGLPIQLQLTCRGVHRPIFPTQSTASMNSCRALLAKYHPNCNRSISMSVRFALNRGQILISNNFQGPNISSKRH